METTNWIGGEWVKPGGQQRDVMNPSNLSEKVGTIHFSNETDIIEAEAAAKEAYRKWSSLPGAKRGDVLYEMAAVLEKNMTDIAELASSEMGKPITEMKGEVLRGVQLLRYYASEGVRSQGNLVPSSDVNVLQYTKRVPLGVVGLITPWNFPVAIPIWKMAPALISGNTILWKPAEPASLTAVRLGELFAETNLPNGVVNIVIGRGRDVGNALLEKTEINAISFTGSTSTGQRVASICAARNIKYQTEMGGKNAAIVLRDADFQKAASMVVSGAFRSAGQKCTATSRIIVEKEAYEPFVEALKLEMETIKVNHALDKNAYMGPVASKSQFDSVSEYVSVAKKEAELVIEKEIEQGNDNGYFVNPMVVAGISPDHKLVQEEVFGPLAVILTADDFEEAISLANQTVYGLSASIFTQDLSKAHRFLDEADAGMVRVNQETAGVEYQAPFGGMKMSSSHTREQGQAALDFYTTLKTCAIKHTF
ncbi:aldehyde dehydrogenase family protein [Alkalihalobacillus sp. TS-13]|uniref:aldehyde dehydrogenase family protein n=1 Tax=Alkalihalobacillus sp. TS-13 TaxID=2842455 RepID=UPI001C876F3F|nr:aldehyde dehydrogenase family protein [Alkalihalobacillus sp. TS-13]